MTLSGNTIPLVKLVIPYIIGIYCGFEIQSAGNLGSIAIILGIGITIWFELTVKKFNKRHYFGILIIPLLFFVGNEWAGCHRNSPGALHFSNYQGSEYTYSAISLEDQITKENSYKILAEIIELNRDTTSYSVEGKIIIYLAKDSLKPKIKKGNLLIFNRIPQEISAPTIPLEFDYRKYLSRKDIFHQIYLNNKDYSAYPNPHFNENIISIIRSKLQSQFAKSDFSEEVMAIIRALVFGQKDDLDKDQYSNFSKAGAIHVLAVSGLHVGLIYIILSRLLSILNRHKRTLILKTIILISSLWTYAMITGMSPSVFRAATMFSFMIIAKVLFKQPNIYNTLAASIFVLLLIEPVQIFDVGFQLSYCAVFGIVALQKDIYLIFRSRYNLVNKIWELSSVSIAAQIFTLPLTIYYFHQFPVYFIIANIIVIPLITAILYLAIIYLVFSSANFLAKFLAYILEHLIAFLNKFVQYIADLPHSIIESLSISPLQSFILFLIIIFYVIFYKLKWKFAFHLSLLSLLFFLISELSIDYQNQSGNWIYTSQKEYYILSYSGEDCILYTEENHLKASKFIDYKLSNHLDYLELQPNTINNTDSEFVFNKAGFMFVGDYSFLIPNDDLLKEYSAVMPKCDFILITEKIDHLDQWFDLFNNSNILLSSKLNYYEREKVLAFLKEKNLKYYDLKFESLDLTLMKRAP